VDNQQKVVDIPPANEDLLRLEYVDLPKRRLNSDTCRLFGYGVTTYNGEPVQVATYCDEGGVAVAQKIRFKNKDFRIIGDSKSMLLYGRNLWKSGGRMVVVTEGEVDALSVSQAQGNKWPVVSLPNGAQSAAKAVKKNLDWLEGFDTVVLMFDMDEAGQNAARECALLLTPGKAKIAHLSMKDPNELLVNSKVKSIIDGIWQAKVFRPDGIVAGNELWDTISSPPESCASINYPWMGLNEKTYGMRQRELVVLTSGSGIGKSSVCRELAHHLITHGQTIGYIALEESVRRTALGLMGIHLNRPLHIEMAVGGDQVDEDSLREAYEKTVGCGRVYLYDHFGSINSDNLLSRIRYMVRALNCKWIFLDHLSIVVSGLGDGDERRLIDNTMTALRSLVEELGCGLILVSHLKRPEGRGHEEGAQTSLAQLRGSAAIGQLSDIVIGLERNQQDPDNPDEMSVRVLKNRFSGDTGLTCRLTYDRDSGRLSESSGLAKDFRELGKVSSEF
jgi:twinkle protein